MDLTVPQILYGAVSVLIMIVMTLGGFIVKNLFRRVCKTEEELDEIRENYIERFVTLTKTVTDNKEQVLKKINDNHEEDNEKMNTNHLALLDAIHAIDRG